MFLFLDFESYHDSEHGYDLKELSMLEYVRDERFKIHGYGWALDDLPVDYTDSASPLRAREWQDIDVVAHNAKFDGLILSGALGIKPRSWVCTAALARAVIGPQIKDFSLKTVAAYLGLPSKGELETDGLKDLTPEQAEKLAEYCKHDVELCRDIFYKLWPLFPENQRKYLDWTIRTFVEPKLELNVTVLEEANKAEAEKKAGLVSNLQIDKKILSSNKKFAEHLAAQGYEVPMKRSGRTGRQIPALSMGDPAFLDMLNSNDPDLKQLCEARKGIKSTLMETRSANLARIGKTGKWSFDVQFSGAVQTHRFSGASGAGGNPQNFTRGSALRRAVQAPAGYKLVVGDFAAVEMRIVAFLANDPGLTGLISQGRDVYCDFASAFFGRTITKENVEERRFGKTAILGLGYGMGPKKFQLKVRLDTGRSITDNEAKKAVYLYRSRYNRVPALWRRLDEVIASLASQETWIGVRLPGIPVEFGNRRVRLPSGLELQYPNLRRENDEWVYDEWEKTTETTPTKLYGGKLLENISQALAGELCKEAMGAFLDDCTGQVHDELHLLVKDAEAGEAAAALEAALTRAPAWAPEWILGAEVGIGQNWLEAK